MKISIITVCLNSEQTIEQTIHSVIDQNDLDYEYIIIDGGSEDGTLDIIQRYREEISIVISEPDKGLYDAMNKGIALASGDIIGIINSDDWYEPGTLRKVRACFQESDAEVIYGRLHLVSDNRVVSTLIPSDIEKIRYEMEIPHPTVFIKKEIYDNYGVFQLKYKIASDYDLMLRLYTSGVKFKYQDEVFSNFRLNGISVQKEKECTKETLTISQSYLPYAPLIRRKYYKDIIIHRWKVFYFIDILGNYPDALFETLIKKLGISFNDDVAIFGAGTWGIKMSQILIRSGMSHLFFIDNDRSKWNLSEGNIRIFSPQILESFKGVVLLMAERFIDEILCQIKKINNPELYYITWEEIVNEFKVENLNSILYDRII